MDATEIIKGFIEVLNRIQDRDQEVENQMNADGDDRTSQIQDLKSSEPTSYSNSPQDKIADIDAVTTNAGGGVNGPKHPADIRGEHPSMYPSQQMGFRDYVSQIEQTRGEQ